MFDIQFPFFTFVASVNSSLASVNAAEVMEKPNMYHLFEKGQLKELTIEAAKALVGKKIKTIYFGYNGQDGIDEFTIGSIESLYDIAASTVDPRTGLTLLQQAQRYESFPGQVQEMKAHYEIRAYDGRLTDIRTFSSTSSTFHCSDIDRVVYFTEIA